MNFKFLLASILLSSLAYSYDRVDQPQCNDGEDPSSSPVQCTKKSSGKFSIQGFSNGTRGCKVSFTCIYDPTTTGYSACPTGRGIWSSIDHLCWEPTNADPVVDGYFPYTSSQSRCEASGPLGIGILGDTLADYFKDEIKKVCAGMDEKIITGVGICCTKSKPKTVNPSVGACNSTTQVGKVVQSCTTQE